MALDRYPLASSTWDDAELAAIRAVVDSGIFTMGEQVRRFEEDFASYVGSRYCVMVNSGSSANLLAVAALFHRKESRLQRGDEVIVPAVSWSTTYYPLHQYGMKLKFVDINPETLNMDLAALESAVSDRTRLIMAVNLLGNPNDFQAIRRIIGDRQIALVEDNCESLGATFGDRQCGTFGLMGTFSSFFSHHISTMEGGMVVTDDEELYHILLSIRAHGWTRELPRVNHVCGELSDDPFFESFRFVLPGYNVRPLEMSGAIGLPQLKKLPELVRVRRENALLFQQLFGGDQRFIIQKETGKSSWFGFALTLTEHAGFKRKAMAELLGNSGIECRPIVAGNFARNPVIRWMDCEIHGKLIHADRVHEQGLFVGNHHYGLGAELRYLKQTLDRLS